MKDKMALARVQLKTNKQMSELDHKHFLKLELNQIL